MSRTVNGGDGIELRMPDSRLERQALFAWLHDEETKRKPRQYSATIRGQLYMLMEEVREIRARGEDKLQW